MEVARLVKRFVHLVYCVPLREPGESGLSPSDCAPI